MTNRTYRRDMALSQAVNQLSESPNYLALINAIARTYDDQDDVLSYIANINIDTARGVWLDLLGAIRGIGRRVDVDLEYVWFGYSDIGRTVAGYSRGEYGYLDRPQTMSSLLGDDDYRRAILAKAAIDFGSPSMPVLADVITSMLSADSVMIFNSGDASVDVLFSGRVSKNMLAMIKSGKILTTAAGVGLRLLLQYDAKNSFGYTNLNADAKGYGVGSYPEQVNK